MNHQCVSDIDSLFASDHKEYYCTSCMTEYGEDSIINSHLSHKIVKQDQLMRIKVENSYQISHLTEQIGNMDILRQILQQQLNEEIQLKQSIENQKVLKSVERSNRHEYQKLVRAYLDKIQKANDSLSTNDGKSQILSDKWDEMLGDLGMGIMTDIEINLSGTPLTSVLMSLFIKSICKNSKLNDLNLCFQNTKITRWVMPIFASLLELKSLEYMVLDLRCTSIPWSSIENFWESNLILIEKQFKKFYIYHDSFSKWHDVNVSKHFTPIRSTKSSISMGQFSAVNSITLT